jgi:hypothetical protein
MSKISKIEEITSFVTRHPQTVASQRICREILGEALERFNAEFATDLESGLSEKGEDKIDLYYSLIK